MRSIFKPCAIYIRKIFEKIRKYSLKTPKIKKKIKNKIGSNAKNLRKLEPQPEQTFLMKKKSVCTYILRFL